MTAPIDPAPDEFPRELLAAYADGELDAEGRAAVERWLADHPEALPELHAQRELSPANAGLWERAEPPEPSAAAWAGVRRGIAEALDPAGPASRGRSRWRAAAWALGGLAAAGVAAGVAWLAFGPVAPQEAPRFPNPGDVAKLPPVALPELGPTPRDATPSQPALVAGFAVLPMATDDDVILERVPDAHAGWFPVGRHPLPPLLVLASTEEIALEEVDPSPHWPTGTPKMTTAPGDAPMIFAAKRR
jgi:hypothetical protein